MGGSSLPPIAGVAFRKYWVDAVGFKSIPANACFFSIASKGKAFFAKQSPDKGLGREDSQMPRRENGPTWAHNAHIDSVLPNGRQD